MASDKPLIAVASYSSRAIGVRVAQQQREAYLIGVLISSIILATSCILLFAMNTSRINEKRASAAEVRLASALDVIKDSFAIYDSEGRLCAFNRELACLKRADARGNEQRLTNEVLRR